MSQAHIPQPDAGSAPSEQIQSTDTTFPMQSIEALTPADPQDVNAIGEFNQLDPFFYTQFRRIATVQWTTSDETSKLLWYIPISPLALDKNLAYVIRMYLGWLGGMVFNFKVAGTGFHAGQLVFVKTPPTIHPSKLKSPMDYTIMPWDAVDPKMLEIGSFMGRDTRPIKWHYVQRQDGAPEDYSIGGYLAMFVDLPLSTSSSGVPRINIAIWAKLNMDFKVAWMIPYDLQDPTPSNVAPEPIPYMFDFYKYNRDAVTMSSAIEFANRLAIMPSTQKVINVGLWNSYKLSTDHMSSQPIGPMPLQTDSWGKFTVDNQSGGVVIATSTFYWAMTPAIGDMLFHTEIGSYTIKKVEPDNTKPSTYKLTLDKPFDTPTHTTGWFISTVANRTPQTWVDGNEYASPNNDESFLLFYNDKSKIAVPQHVNFAESCRFGALKNWFEPHQAALFQIYEADAQVPIGYAKLYYDGFMVTKASANQVLLILDRMTLIFNSIVLRTTTIPSNPTMSTNYLLISDKHRRMIKASSKKAKISSTPQRHNLSIQDGSSRSSNGRW